MELVLDLLMGLVTAVFWGIVFLLVAALLRPDRVFAKILRKIRPDLISRTLFVERAKEAFDLLINRKVAIVGGSNGRKAARAGIAKLIAERRPLEGNLFFVDLLKSLATMILFSVTHAGYGEGDVLECL